MDLKCQVMDPHTNVMIQNMVKATSFMLAVYMITSNISETDFKNSLNPGLTIT